jgi:hypothetical protein
MNCPHCNTALTPEEIKRLWGQLCQSKARRPSKRVARERAKKAAAARWANHKKTDT